MKVFAVSLAFLVCVAYTSALQCHYCVPEIHGDRCETTASTYTERTIHNCNECYKRQLDPTSNGEEQFELNCLTTPRASSEAIVTGAGDLKQYFCSSDKCNSSTNLVFSFATLLFCMVLAKL